MAKTLKEIAIANCTKQPHQIDCVLESAPMLERIPFMATSKGLMHFYEKVKSVDAAGFVGIDEALPVADVDTNVESRTLGIMGFKIHGGVDTVKLVTKGGSFSEYLAMKSPKVMTASGMALEQKIARLAKVYAARNGKLINAGGTGAETYTIMAFRFLEGELCGLYDPNGFGQGAFFTTQLLNGGQLYEDPATGKDLYGASFRSYVDFMMENPACVAGIANLTADKLTAAMVDDMLMNVRAGDQGTTIIVGHPKALQFINSMKNPFSTQGTTISTAISTWNGIPILADWNFMGAEAAMASVTDTSSYKLSLSGMDTVSDNGWFFKNKALAAEEAASEVLNLGKGGVLSSLAIRVKAAGELTGVASGTGITITVQHSDKADGDFTKLHSETIEAVPADGGYLMDYTLPEKFKGYAQLLVTGAEGVSGNIDAYAVLVHLG